MVFHVDELSGVPVVCSGLVECGLFHLDSVEEFDGLFECYECYDADCHSDYMQAYMVCGYGNVDPEDYRAVSFEEFCVSGLWIDYMYAPSIDVKRGAGSVVDKDELSDDDDDDVDVLW